MYIYNCYVLLINCSLYSLILIYYYSLCMRYVCGDHSYSNHNKVCFSQIPEPPCQLILSFSSLARLTSILDLQSASVFVSEVSFLETADSWILFSVQSANLHVFIVLRLFTLNIIEKDLLVPITLFVVFLIGWSIVCSLLPQPHYISFTNDGLFPDSL